MIQPPTVYTNHCTMLLCLYFADSFQACDTRDTFSYCPISWFIYTLGQQVNFQIRIYMKNQRIFNEINCKHWNIRKHNISCNVFILSIHKMSFIKIKISKQSQALNKHLPYLGQKNTTYCTLIGWNNHFTILLIEYKNIKSNIIRQQIIIVLILNTLLIGYSYKNRTYY